MSFAIRSCGVLSATLLAAFVVACEEPEAPKPAASASAQAKVAPVVSAKPPPPPKPREDCPAGSSGPGTFDAPCLGSADSRLMKVEYTGKTTDEGPKFSVTNLTKQQILYGSVAVYFYDKAGKQLQVPDAEKPRPLQLCSGNIFAGAVKPDEKIFVFFSCVKKSHVPDGTAAIEAEVQTVGIADAAGEKNEFYWKNPDLAPAERPQGGVKPAAKK